MRVLVLLAILCSIVPSSAVVCNTSGNAGQDYTLIQSVFVDFGTTVVSTYSGNELARAFDVYLISGRPLFVKTASVSGTLVNLTLNASPTDDTEPQTGLSVRVNYTQLPGVSGNLTAGGSLVTTGVKCLTSNDNVAPISIVAATTVKVSATPGAIYAAFSEPVRLCGAKLYTSNLTLNARVSVGVTEITPFVSTLSNVWTFGFTSINFVGGTPTVRFPSWALCDLAGNQILLKTMDITRDVDIGTTTVWALDQKLYDLDTDGRVDALLLTTLFPIQNSFASSSNVELTIGGQSVSVSSVDAEEFSTDNTVLLKVPNTAPGSGTVVYLNTSVYAYPLTGSVPIDDIPTALFIPAFVSSISASYGSFRVNVTVSAAHSTSLSASQFHVDVNSGLSIVSSLSSTTTSIILELDGLVTRDIGIYLKPLTYGTDAQSYPLWRTVAFDWDIRNISFSGTPWDTLIVNYSSTAVSSSLVLTSLALHSYTVDSETVSGNAVIYKVSRTCVATTPCFTTNADFTLNLTSSIVNAVAVDLSVPAIVGYSVIVGANKIRVQFSETVTLGHSTPFEIHENGLLATSYTQSGSVLVFTLERAVKSSDSTTGWNPLTITDAAGNTAAASVPDVFSVTVEAFSNKLRLTTSLAHQDINSSMIQTVPFVELGEVTRLSVTVTEIEATITSSSVTIEHLGGILLSSGQRSGFELLRADFPITGEVVSVDSSDGMNYGLAGGLIAGAFVVGIIITWQVMRSSISSRKYRRIDKV